GGAVPDAATGEFLVVIRDLANNPRSGVHVIVDFSSCPQLRICADQHDPEAVVNCAIGHVQKFTNELGEVRFTILGSSTGYGQAEAFKARPTIYATGVRMGSPAVATFDLDGT